MILPLEEKALKDSLASAMVVMVIGAFEVFKKMLSTAVTLVKTMGEFEVIIE